MKKIKGMKTVDFKIEAEGYGCVNWNGNVDVFSNGKFAKNHSIPKMRGLKLKKKVNDKMLPLSPDEIELSSAPVYVSQNCIRHNLFKEDFPFHIGKMSEEHALNFLRHPSGILRGYAIAVGTPIMKKSPLLLEDFVESLGNLNFEVFTNSGSKESDTGGFYSKTTIGETKYSAYGSINLEELQFISLDGIFGRNAVGVTFKESDVPNLVKAMEEMLNDLNFDESRNPEVLYDPCWVRKGSCVPVGEAGLLLNSDAVLILVDYMLEKLENLYIQQAKGWLRVKSVVVDYNEGKTMRIKEDDSMVDSEVGEVACYFERGTEDQLKESLKLKEENSSAHKKRKSSKAKK